MRVRLAKIGVGKKKRMNIEKPRIGWAENRTYENSDGACWVKCKVCGDEKLAWKSSLGGDDFVCKACREKTEDIVSMRCRRHKKRFNVPRWWMDISQWLCPSCYERLSEDERIRYAPKGESPLYREAELGKPILKPRLKKEGYVANNVDAPVEDGVVAAINANQIEEVSSTQEACPVEPLPDVRQDGVEKGKNKKEKRGEKHSISDNPAFAGLLPSYKITCQHCGHTVPCHHSWFEKSTVLCPSCYWGMNETKRMQFHELHKSDKTNEKYTQQIRMPEKTLRKPVVLKSGGWTRQSHLVNSGGYWSNNRIMSATENELRVAARQGIVSNARMRIELRRRANISYYNMFPQEVGVRPIFT